MSITDLENNIKYLGSRIALFISSKDTLLSLVIIATALTSYVVGANSVSSKGNASGIVFNQIPTPNYENTNIATGTESIKYNRGESQAAGVGVTSIFASRNGSKYYYSWCKSAGRIKDKNKVYYDTKEQAIASGKSLASSCK